MHLSPNCGNIGGPTVEMTKVCARAPPIYPGIISTIKDKLTTCFYKSRVNFSQYRYNLSISTIMVKITIIYYIVCVKKKNNSNIAGGFANSCKMI